MNSNILSKALTDKDILNLMDHKVNIMTYEDVHKYNNIRDITGRYGAIILIMYKPNEGHWITVFEGGDGALHVFNSYGDMEYKYQGYPDEFLKLIKNPYREESFQDKPYLSELMLNSDYDRLEYNDHQFQSLNKNIRTCGRWCILRLLCRNLTDDEFIKYVQDNCKHNNLSQDELVCSLIN